MWAFWFLVPIVLLALVAINDRRQRSNTIIANFPIVGRFRYWFEALGGPLRQYIVTSNDEERPFTRDQRRWVYASAAVENNYFGFGTDNELEQTTGYLIIRQSTFPITSPVKGQPGYDPKYRVPCAKILGGYRNRKHAFRPPSIVNTSAMSYGSLSGAAIESINRGVAIAGAWQNTGEGGISPYHRKGGDLLWQLGTGYYGCRDEKGNFSMERFLENVASAPVKGIEIKLSQGAKPGLGGVLPAAKITPEISAIRHVPMGKDCISPASHGAFSDVSSMLDFIERLADASGLPVGIKAAVGQMGFWHELAKQMETTGSRAGLHQHRRRRGRHGCGAAGLQRPRLAAVQAGLHQRVPRHGRARHAREGGLHRHRQAGLPAAGAVLHGPRLRPGQRGARGHAGHRLHPGPGVPHRPLPHGCRHAEALAGEGARPHAQVGAPRQLPDDAPQGDAGAGARVRRGAPGRGGPRQLRHRGWVLHAAGARGLRL
jgi:hypothetical protein